MQMKPSVSEEDERRMADWRRLHPEDVAGEEAFWAAKTARRKRRRERKKFLEARLDNPSSSFDIDENST
jgi:hypothetical protein